MKYTDLLNKHNLFTEYLNKYQVKESMDILEELTDNCSNSDYKNRFNNHYNTYQNILKYSFELGDDPEKVNVYQKLLRSVIELADDAKEDIVVTNRLLHYHASKKDVRKKFSLTESDSGKIVNTIEFEREIEEILNQTKGISQENDKMIQNDNQLSNIFKYIWLTDKFQEAEIQLVRQIREASALPWYDKSLIVSSLTISLLRHFDINKFNLLFEFYDSRENQVWQRAFIGIIMGLYAYDNRITFYPELIQRLKVWQGDESMEKNLEILIIQYIRQKESEKLARKIQDEFIPDMMKMKSKLEDKLDLENIISSKTFEEKNPEWESYFKDSPDLYKKFEELSMMQIEGADIFLGAFSMLKRFPFFHEITNWFIPFYKENDTIKELQKEMQDGEKSGKLIEGIEKSYFLCNSDKYSFCHNIKHMPSLQQSTMLEVFNMELKAMNEMTEDTEKINIDARNKTVFTQYLQDLYRFFKLYPLKKEFTDVFNLKPDIYETKFYDMLIDNTRITRNIGEFYFEKNYYQEALKIFNEVLKKNKENELLEKIGFCYQQTGQFEKALETYHKAELLDKNRKWILQKIAYCYRRTGNYKKSLEYYQQLEKLDPENLHIQSYLGHSYMDIGDFETALNYYYKVEYMAPDNHKIQRPIAWCSFILNKLEPAKKYFEKVIQKEANKNDYMNLGHLLWCMGNKKEAIEKYKKSVQKSNMDFKWFTRVFNEDKKYLIEKNIPPFDIPLMIDYIKMSFK